MISWPNFRLLSMASWRPWVVPESKPAFLPCSDLVCWRFWLVEASCPSLGLDLERRLALYFCPLILLTKSRRRRASSMVTLVVWLIQWFFLSFIYLLTLNEGLFLNYTLIMPVFHSFDIGLGPIFARPEEKSDWQVSAAQRMTYSTL